MTEGHRAWRIGGGPRTLFCWKFSATLLCFGNASDTLCGLWRVTCSERQWELPKPGPGLKPLRQQLQQGRAVVWPPNGNSLQQLCYPWNTRNMGMRKGLGLGVRAALSSKTVFPKGINCFLRVTGDREVEFGPVFPPAHAFRKHKCSCKSIFRSCKTKPNFSTINPSGTRTNPLHMSSIHSLLPVLVYPLLTLPPTNQTTTRAKGRHCFYFNFHKECLSTPLVLVFH